MKLYSSPVAPSPKKVLVFISEKGIKDIEVKDLDIGKMEHKTDEYKKIAPNSRIPALVLDNGDVILETTAICRYLECLHPDPNMFGENPEEIAKIEMWYSRISFELMMPLMHGFRHTHPHMSALENQNNDFTNKSSTNNEYSKWVDNQGDEVKNVFGFNSSAELVNGRAAMIGFLMLILTELVFSGRPVTSSIFGIN